MWWESGNKGITCPGAMALPEGPARWPRILGSAADCVLFLRMRFAGLKLVRGPLGCSLDNPLSNLDRLLSKGETERPGRD